MNAASVSKRTEKAAKRRAVEGIGAPPLEGSFFQRPTLPENILFRHAAYEPDGRDRLGKDGAHG